MTPHTDAQRQRYAARETGVLLVDPYNDFLSDGAGSWGGEWHPDFAPRAGDVVVEEHWGGSGFANTDLDLLLKQSGVRRVILIGLIANTCIETTARFAVELGYHVTLVRDATAAFSREAMHAAHEINAPAFAHAVLTTAEPLPLLGEMQSGR